MSVKKSLKKIGLINAFGKMLNIMKAYWGDAKDFSDYFMNSVERKGDYKYSILLLVHSIEKGMCMPDPRPFGFEKIKQLIFFLENTEDKNSFEYRLGISVLFAWVDFFEQHNWVEFDALNDVKDFIKEKNSDLVSGKKEYEPRIKDFHSFEEIINSRHSVRDFQSRKIEDSDIEYAVDAFLETPTACNRQMCGIVYIEDEQVKAKLDGMILGIHGFSKEHTHYFVITYDLSAFAYSGERQQGMFNSGLCTTNFINALHVRGIGSCCLQWSNRPNEDKEMRNMLHLKESERIAVVIGVGYYLDCNTIPCSVRKKKSDIYRVC